MWVYTNICKYLRILVWACADYCRKYVQIFRVLYIFIPKYSKIFEYFLVISAKHPKFARRI